MWVLFVDESSVSVLESDTRYIPLYTSELGNLTSPTSQPPECSPPPNPAETATACDKHENPSDQPEGSEYPVLKLGRAVSSTAVARGRMAANFQQTTATAGSGRSASGPGGPLKPSLLDVNPHLHNVNVRRRSISPLAQAQEFLGMDTSDSDSMSSEGSATLQLQLLKAILQNRKTKKAIRKSLHDASLHASCSASAQPQRDLPHPVSAVTHSSSAAEAEGWRQGGVDAEVEQVMMQDEG